MKNESQIDPLTCVPGHRHAAPAAPPGSSRGEVWRLLSGVHHTSAVSLRHPFLATNKTPEPGPEGRESRRNSPLGLEDPSPRPTAVPAAPARLGGREESARGFDSSLIKMQLSKSHSIPDAVRASLYFAFP